MYNSKKRNPLFYIILVLILAGISSCSLRATDRVRVAGSHAMYPIVTAVAERYSYETGEKAPIVEATGTGGGIKVFCSGNGKRFADMVVASRPMSQAEKEFCVRNGVMDIHEIMFGFDGIVLAHSIFKKGFSVSMPELRMAFNNSEDPPLLWSDIHRKLPVRLIRIYGPPATSGTREALEMLLGEGEKNFSIRKDGQYVDASDQENVIAQKLMIESGAIGVFSYGFYEKNHDRLRAVRIERIRPHYQAIVKGQYPLSRSLYVYLKKSSSNISKSLFSFVEALLDPLTSGPQGYLRAYGFIALPYEKHQDMRVKALHFLERNHKLDEK